MLSKPQLLQILLRNLDSSTMLSSIWSLSFKFMRIHWSTQEHILLGLQGGTTVERRRHISTRKILSLFPQGLNFSTSRSVCYIREQAHRSDFFFNIFILFFISPSASLPGGQLQMASDAQVARDQIEFITINHRLTITIWSSYHARLKFTMKRKTI